SVKQRWVKRSPWRSSTAATRWISIRSEPRPMIMAMLRVRGAPPTWPPPDRGWGCPGKNSLHTLDAATARLDGRDGGQFGRQLVGGIGRHLELDQADQRHADVGFPGGAVDQAGGGNHIGADGLQGGDAFANGQAGGDNVFDDDDLVTRRDFKAAAQFELTIDAFGIKRRHP